MGLSLTASKNFRLACALCGAPHKAHVRHYFFQAVQLNGKDLVALGIVVEIDKLFEIEADAKSAGLGAEERLELRREKAEPILESLKTRIESARAAALPRSALGKACDYAMGRWAQLRRFLDYGQLELSNNLAENAIRPVAVGRKNWLHIGSERAGPRVAAILSVIETCRRYPDSPVPPQRVAGSGRVPRQPRLRTDPCQLGSQPKLRGRRGFPNKTRRRQPWVDLRRLPFRRVAVEGVEPSDAVALV